MTNPLSTAFISLWVIFALINAFSFYRSYIKRRFTSPVMLVGGLFGLVGFYLLPNLRKWCWIALLLDYGSVAFFLALPKVARELWQTSRINLIREFVGERTDETITVRIYRAGVVVVEKNYTRKPGELGLVQSSDMGYWRENAGVLTLSLHGDSFQLKQLGDTWKADLLSSTYAESDKWNGEHLEFKERF